MKSLVIVGGGTAGTILANRMSSRLPRDWTVQVVEPSTAHLYQPGLLFLPFGDEHSSAIQRPRGPTFASGVEWVKDAVLTIDVQARTLALRSNKKLRYDLLVLATGSVIRPDLLKGLTSVGWRDTAHDFYSLEGAVALRKAFRGFQGGRLVLNVAEMPIKCPLAPLEFLFLADAWLSQRGLREKTELVYVTPLDGPYSQPVAARTLSALLDEKGVKVTTRYLATQVDGARKKLISSDGSELPYDLLVVVPAHAGAPFLEGSGLGDALGFIPTDKHTLAALQFPDTFVLGDATNLPSAKIGSVAHFQAELLEKNLVAAMHGRPLAPLFDGHSNCFIETGHGKAMLLDSNYEVEPLPGHYPVPGVGPFTLLQESRRNHWGMKAFKWVYWNALLPGLPIPMSPRMSMIGKHPHESGQR